MLALDDCTCVCGQVTISINMASVAYGYDVVGRHSYLYHYWGLVYRDNLLPILNVSLMLKISRSKMMYLVLLMHFLIMMWYIGLQ